MVGLFLWQHQLPVITTSFTLYSCNNLLTFPGHVPITRAMDWRSRSSWHSAPGAGARGHSEQGARPPTASHSPDQGTEPEPRDGRDLSSFINQFANSNVTPTLEQPGDYKKSWKRNNQNGKGNRIKLHVMVANLSKEHRVLETLPSLSGRYALYVEKNL